MRVGVGTWWTGRRRMAALAILVAALTGTGLAALGEGGSYIYGSAAYTLLSAVALVYPPAIAVQVITGQGLAGAILLGPADPAPILLLPAVVGVVAAAELSAISARLGSPVERSPRSDLARAAGRAVTGAFVFGAVLLIGTLPGPTGMVAVSLASLALLGLAMVLAGRTG